jgi:hypothetical protein
MSKHQTNCYRTIKGERYVNLCDVLSPADEALVLKAKAVGAPHRIIKHPDGFKMLFVSERQIHLVEI